MYFVLLYDKVSVLVVVVNKQLADKERVAAAIENATLLTVLNQCLS